MRVYLRDPARDHKSRQIETLKKHRFSAKLGQGRDKVKEVLAENPDLCDELEAKLDEKIKELGLETVLNKIGK